MRYFCTYFDQHYLLRGFLLYRSLQSHCPDFQLYVLSLDQVTFETLNRLALPGLVPIALPEVESWIPDLETAKGNRSTIEYYFTLSPALPLFILENRPQVDMITYVDADIFFYADPEIAFSEMGAKSILVTEHRFPPRLKYMEQKGRFNVQFLSFRRNLQGIACLKRWSQQCVDWCYARVSGNRFADQKYLDEWPVRYSDLHILQHPGCAVGPWNWTTAPIELKGDSAYVDGAPLVFYHFHGMKILNHNLVSLGMYRYGKMPPQLRRWFNGDYVANLKQASEWLRATHPSLPHFRYQDFRNRQTFLRSLVEGLLARQLMLIK